MCSIFYPFVLSATNISSSTIVIDLMSRIVDKIPISHSLENSHKRPAIPGLERQVSYWCHVRYIWHLGMGFNNSGQSLIITQYIVWTCRKVTDIRKAVTDKCFKCINYGKVYFLGKGRAVINKFKGSYRLVFVIIQGSYWQLHSIWVGNTEQLLISLKFLVMSSKCVKNE